MPSNALWYVFSMLFRAPVLRVCHVFLQSEYEAIQQLHAVLQQGLAAKARADDPFYISACVSPCACINACKMQKDVTLLFADREWVSAFKRRASAASRSAAAWVQALTCGKDVSGATRSSADWPQLPATGLTSGLTCAHGRWPPSNGGGQARRRIISGTAWRQLVAAFPTSQHFSVS